MRHNLNHHHITNKNRFVVSEGNAYSSLMFIGFGAIAVGIIYYSMKILNYCFSQPSFSRDDYFLLSLILATDVFALFMGYRIFQYFKRYGKPLMILDPKGILLLNFANQIPWSEVETYTIRRVSVNFVPIMWEVHFFFTDNFSQKFIKSGRSQSKYREKKNQLTMLVYGIKGHMSAKKLIKIIENYRKQAGLYS